MVQRLNLMVEYNKFMSDLAIRVENLSKRYRLGQREPYKTLGNMLATHLCGLGHRKLREELMKSLVEVVAG